MDHFIINLRIAYGICYLACLNILDSFFHGFNICIHIRLRHKADHCCDSLRNGLCRDYDNIFVFCKRPCLICSKNDIFVVWQDEDMVRIYFINGREHIVCARVHRLSALDDIIHAQFTEDLVHPVSDGNGDKSNRFSRLFLLFRLCSLSLLRSDFLCVADQLFLMLLAHIIDLHA